MATEVDVLVQGNQNSTLGALTLASEVDVAVVGILNSVLEGVSLDANNFEAEGVKGVLTVRLDNLGFAAIAQVPVKAIFNQGLAEMSLAASGIEYAFTRKPTKVTAAFSNPLEKGMAENPPETAAPSQISVRSPQKRNRIASVQST